MPREIHRTEFLALRKLPHLGANLIVSGLSPEYGRLTFYLKHAAAGDSHHFQLFDAFRLLTVDFIGGRDSDFCRCRGAELNEDFSAVARDYSAFQAACDLARFCLDNVLADDPRPRAFRAVRVALARLQARELPRTAVLTGFALNYLMESGLFDYGELSPREQAQCRLLLEMGDGGAAPVLKEETWERLWEWTRLQLVHAELALPPSFRLQPAS